tara:strand:+ start:92 stop:361 length:270 start_codon:yes stop_codon:yes gene_type:complete
MPTNVTPLKRSEYSEDVELELRKIGKDYCEQCGKFLHGSEVSPKRLEGWLEGKEKATCPKCRNLSSLKTRMLIILILVISMITSIIIIT